MKETPAPPRKPQFVEIHEAGGRMLIPTWRILSIKETQEGETTIHLEGEGNLRSKTSFETLASALIPKSTTAGEQSNAQPDGEIIGYVRRNNGVGGPGYQEWKEPVYKNQS
jgi:hypothetical protein